ncbi:hypothetical protein BOTBODRAFT_25891 [Botryobasidium botryosum FD-172 SS1]|uniref:Probable acetate kinase n=1 Tax=Botryobasidium botryosum (strain FD-172 SS1) TaxID=930990 RepID=A0A067N0D0_BOTB1|nr:hypothetical protein BOTBODRAFT_25891 [Botryobasidium botryosum FD-172 SS1]
MSAPRDLILSVNAGSSSLKISVFKPTHKADKEPVELLLTASFSNIFSPLALFSLSPKAPGESEKSRKNEEVQDVKDHESAFEYFLKSLQDSTSLERDQIAHVCHRVVHGGNYPEPVRISNESYHHIEDLTDLAPLHNAAALSVIKASLKILPDSSSIAFFDTAFHRTIPEHIAKYAIDPEIAESKGLKKYGFHGLSYSYILRATASFLKKDPSETSLIVMHLGSGASVCAIQRGASLDTSMGLTPLDGLPGATRSGGTDPSLIFHYTSKAGKVNRKTAENVHITDAEEILNKKAGWKALTGTTDFAEIAEKAAPSPRSAQSGGRDEHSNHTLAFHILVDRIIGFVGSYYLKLGGASHIDALVFAGGLGEHSAALRSAVAVRCKCLGFYISEDKNKRADDMEGDVVDLGDSHGQEHRGGMRVLLCHTDEQLEMARQCALHPEFSNELSKK